MRPPRTEIKLDLPENQCHRLLVTVDYIDACIRMDWNRFDDATPVGSVIVRCIAPKLLQWSFLFKTNSQEIPKLTTNKRPAVRAELGIVSRIFPTYADEFRAQLKSCAENGKPVIVALPLPPPESIWEWIEDKIVDSGQIFRAKMPKYDLYNTRQKPNQTPPAIRKPRPDKPAKAEQKSVGVHGARGSGNRQIGDLPHKEAAPPAIEKPRTDKPAKADVKPVGVHGARGSGNRQTGGLPHKEATDKQGASVTGPVTPLPPVIRPLPDVPQRMEMSALEFQDSVIPKPDLKSYFLQERAARWWVSNQSDDLLCLSYCRIERLDYQVRSALRVIGPLRGRALLSDEVGLGKTVEAGLVLKEYLTRGMVRRALILTVPSLVDQWEEEMSDKFNLTAATTNHAAFRAAAGGFWESNALIIASMHTAKQPAHLAAAQKVSWDMLIVDEAHYLRNRDSQAWQAINSLPRQFLLLLTATPVQNSLEELYNLVTLLQPGQLPSPKEFNARFINKTKPHEPREPEELRRLLSQVMIRNTRANAGVNLPPRQAETVLFEPEPEERQFWETWETEFRSTLLALSASQAKLWGRLLLQSSGSSPHAWRQGLQKYPDRAASKRWATAAPLEKSWKKKCEALIPLARGEGGVVIFTQFLETQAAMAAHLRAAKLHVWVINGQTPAVQRQPITEEFRKFGGALLLTHSGTEGRNLQFSHTLVNFDLPWNPMEIEQRIGRLHRLGQKHPVRIYNFVQAGTLQEHLLNILQEKLNLFELIVGETGLILGDSFSSDEFADEIFRRWQESEGHLAESMESLGDELAKARANYQQFKQLDDTLFSKDYESL